MAWMASRSCDRLLLLNIQTNYRADLNNIDARRSKSSVLNPSVLLSRSPFDLGFGEKEIIIEQGFADFVLYLAGFLMLVMETPSADVLVSNMSWPRFIVSGNCVSF
jgi:hypothetical protein